MFNTPTLQLLIRSLADRGDRPALISFRRTDADTWSFIELAGRIRRLAAGFQNSGIQTGTMVALCCPNSAEWILICCALLETGAVPVPIDTQLDGDDLRHVLEDAAVKWIVTSRSLAKRLEEIGLAHHVSRIMTDIDPTDEGSWERFVVEPGPPAPTVDENDPAVLFYTSGTTGFPKGVCLSHRNVTANLDGLLRLAIVKSDDRILIPLPLHHVYPFVVGMLASLAAGVPIILPFSPTGPQLTRALTGGEATVLIGVPRLYEVLLTAIKARVRQRGLAAWSAFRTALRLSVMLRRRVGLRVGRWMFASLHHQLAPKLRVAVSGGAALDADVAWALEGFGWLVASGYGLTETSPILTFNEPGGGRIGSAGQPLDRVELRLAQSESEREGEVLARGPNVFSGYRNLPEETRKVLRSDGFFRTGDRGYFDDGFLMLTGRVGSLIKLGAGENIQPDKVEEVLMGSELIQEAGIFEEEGQLAALVVPSERIARDEDSSKTQERLMQEIQRVTKDLPSHQQVGAVAVARTPLPRTRLGKLRRHKLRDRFRALRESPQAASEKAGEIDFEQLSPEDRRLLENPHVHRVCSWIVRRFPDRRVTPESHLRSDLGVESLDWISLSLALHEHIGVELSQEAIGRIETIRDLLREVEETEGAEKTAAQDPLLRLERPEDVLEADQKRWLAPRHVLHRAAGAGLAKVNRVLIRWRYRVRISGRTHLPHCGPFLIVSNHVSLLDPLVIAAALPDDLLKTTFWTGWSGIMFRNFLMRWLSRALQVVPIDPRSGPLASIALGVHLLRKGHPLVWFPEGGRSRNGTLQSFQPGVGILLAAASAPIIPTWIEGTYRAMPTGAMWPAPSQVTISFGDPLDLKALDQGTSDGDRYAQIAQALHDQVERLARTPSPP